MTSSFAPLPSPDRLFPGESELAARMRALDWSQTPLGPTQGWPQSLRTAVSIVLASAAPMVMLWGEDLVQLYNDGYRDVMGVKHPLGLGQRTQDCWPEVWAFNSPLYEQVQERGETFLFTDQPLVITRHGADEEAFFTLSYSPIRDEQGEVGGVLVTVQETTLQVLAQQQLEERNTELQARTRALQAFAQLTREMVNETDRYALIRRAQEIVLSLLTPGYAVYYELQQGIWQIKSQVGDLGNEELQRLSDAGFPAEIPTLHGPWTTGEAFYQDVYAQGSDTPIGVIQQVNAAVSLVLKVYGVPVGIFALGLFDQRCWNATDRAVFDTVIQSLSVALERADQAGQLVRQRDILELRAAELKAANQELEAFSYSVSHDLRTPVRHILGFSDLLRKTLEGQLSEQAARYLGVLEESAGRMNTLIDALLELAHASRLPQRLERVDLGALVQMVLAELELEPSARQIRWAVLPLPVVLGDQGTLRQVIVNLLSNALKYTRLRHEALIEVWAEERPDEWAILVRDNGAGFDATYADKLFGVFQRLHSQKEFEGVGVGLANVRRIVQRHGGRVWAEGRVQQGATFGFSLPKLP